MPHPKLKAGTLAVLNKILIERVLPELSQLIKNQQDEFRSKLFCENLGNGINAIGHAVAAANNQKAYNDSLPPYQNRHYALQSGWQTLILNEFLKFNSKGSAYITSISECLIKTLGLINVHQQNYNRTLAYYRGQVNAEWEIQSSIGRKIKSNEIPSDRNSVSTFEINALRKWQEKVLSDKELKEEIFSNSQPLNTEDPEWWALKQHYDDDLDTGGSRLIDWSSSPLAGLYFACVDWDGSVDESIDGGLFVLMKGVGRLFASKSFVSKLDSFEQDYYDISGETVETYFNFTEFSTYPNTVISENENTRQISQDGHFIFHQEFEKPIENWAGPKPFFFVIPGENKKDILRELFSLGYTPKKIVRGMKGRIAHEKLKKELGIVE